MKRVFLKRWSVYALATVLFLSSVVIGVSGVPDKADATKQDSKVVLAIHGGAGGGSIAEDQEEAYREDVRAALDAGKESLDAGGSSVDAVEAAVRILEDSPLFNAGKGAVFNDDAAHELDASIMSGENLEAGAVAGSKHAKNPITLARTIMEESQHVMLGGDSADWFGMQHGVEMVTQDYYYTQRRWDALMRAKEKENEAAGFGTVGAVAIDAAGNLAAATSTGGLTNKHRGRIGDSPIIGAGTYANNDSVAVSATGTGEVFIRGTAAADIAALVRYADIPVKEAARTVIHEKLISLGGTGGVIALDQDGNFAAPYSTKRMTYGYVTEDGQYVIVLSPDDEPEDAPPPSAADIKARVEAFKEAGEFKNDGAARSLITHLTATVRYEAEGQADKVVKHMTSFLSLLDHQKERDLISEKAYHALYNDAESLIQKWQ